MSTEAQLREDMCGWGKSLFNRGLAPGSSGNLSARLDDGSILTTPTNACLGSLDPGKLSKLNKNGGHLSGDVPTKESPLHLGIYAARPSAKGIVHLHSPYATAFSCLSDVNPNDAIPPITPYVVMRVGRVAMLPYAHPGSTELARLLTEKAREHAAVLLANHGPIVAARTFEAAVFAAEELEEAAKLLFLTRGLAIRQLSPTIVAELNQLFRFQ